MSIVEKAEETKKLAQTNNENLKEYWKNEIQKFEQEIGKKKKQIDRKKGC